MKLFSTFLPLIAFAGLFSSISATAQDHIKVAEFNTWGVPLVVWDKWRYETAMDQLVKMDPDFILLSEVFTHKGRRGFHSDHYPYHANGPRSIPRLVGSGLKILSKHPIERSATLVYRACKKDDCLSRKGAVLAVITLPSGKKLNLVATHLNARGTDETRIDQLKQLKEFTEYYADPSAPILMGGDFNFLPNSAAYQYLQNQYLLAEDLWTKTQDSNNPGYTFDAVANDYTREYAIKTGFPLTQERVDFMFSIQSTSDISGKLAAISSRLIFNQAPYLSDHFGLLGEYDVQ